MLMIKLVLYIYVFWNSLEVEEIKFNNFYLIYNIDVFWFLKKDIFFFLEI